MKHEGNWRVMRRCCTSGNCIVCKGATTGKGAVMVEQMSGLSEAYAKFVAENWHAYKAVAELMPQGK